MHLRSRNLPKPSASSPPGNRSHPMANPGQAPNLEGLHREIHNMAEQMRIMNENNGRLMQLLTVANPQLPAAPSVPDVERSRHSNRSGRSFGSTNVSTERARGRRRASSPSLRERSSSSESSQTRARVRRGRSPHRGDQIEARNKSTSQKIRDLDARLDAINTGTNAPVTVDTLVRQTDLPFTERVLRARISSKFKLPTQLGIYEGKTDPMDHLDSYKSLMSLQGCSDEVMSRAFSATLTGPARSWFRKLSPGTIDSFGELSRLFVANFMRCKNRQKNASHLFTVHQKKTESLNDFVKRFNQAVLEVEDPSDKVTKRGYLRKYVAARLPANSPERRYGDNRPTAGDIQTIHGGFGSGGYSTSSRKRHARSAHRPAEEEIYNLSSSLVGDQTLITFSNDDLRGLHLPHDDALVVSAVIANFNAQRILIDNGSSADILFISAFERMKIGLDKLHPFHTPLIGFGGNTTHPLGWINLSITLGTEPHQTTVWQDFIVVDCPSPYNAILGRPTLGGIKAITSTYHLKLKFPTPTGIGEIKGDHKNMGDDTEVLRDEVEQLALADPRETNNTKPLEETVPISIHPEYPDHHIMIGTELTSELRFALIHFLKENSDVFAWSQRDVPGIDPEIAMHKLFTNPKHSPVRQKRRKFAPERLKDLAHWILFVNGSSNQHGCGARLVIQTPSGEQMECIPLELLASPSIGVANQILQIEENLTWMDEIIAYLQRRILPKDKLQARRLQYRSARFCIFKGKLYKSSFSGPLLKYLRPEEAGYVLREIDEGICGNHSGARSLAKKTIRQEYFWPTIERDAATYIRRCDKCQRFEIPKVIISNNARQFDNDKFRLFCSDLAISHHFSSPGHPQANGQVEVTNRTILRNLKARTSNFDKESNEVELRLNLDLLKERREKAELRQAAFKCQVAKYYNQRVKHRSFLPGDLVLRRVTLSTKEPNAGKLGPTWEGPYKVVQVSRPGTYWLEDPNGKALSHPWNAEHLKKYYQ
ncbi:hypothetical protein Acr_10g0001700 [Actinidia rufa]|uniref:Integrase catalytic domain-containing protein n=1 Tax=Actinidia rufa TaxID=165716 RepID=A0A7J0F7W2_9ERIC|nr:hypothetical protein Acr_10g0001700 [Actinidia rufa]